MIAEMNWPEAAVIMIAILGVASVLMYLTYRGFKNIERDYPTPSNQDPTFTYIHKKTTTTTPKPPPKTSKLNPKRKVDYVDLSDCKTPEEAAAKIEKSRLKLQKEYTKRRGKKVKHG